MSDAAALATLHPAVGLLQLLAAGLLVAIILSTLHTAWSLTHPPRRTYGWAVARRVAGDPSELEPSRPYDVFTFRGVRHELPAWRVPADNPEGPIVVLTHGWGSSRVGGLKRLAPVLPHAREAVLWDLPGHGEAPGTARMGTDEHLDLAALLDTLSPPDRPVPIVLFGWSLGAGVCLRAAAENAGRHDIRAVIAEAPYIHAPTPARIARCTRPTARLRAVSIRSRAFRPASRTRAISIGAASLSWSSSTQLSTRWRTRWIAIPARRWIRSMPSRPASKTAASGAPSAASCWMSSTVRSEMARTSSDASTATARTACTQASARSPFVWAAAAGAITPASTAPSTIRIPIGRIHSVSMVHSS